MTAGKAENAGMDQMADAIGGVVQDDHCPFCGALGDWMSPKGNRGEKFIRCGSCSATGPVARTVALAWARWINRAGPDQ